jgi:hypothetical protein
MASRGARILVSLCGAVLLGACLANGEIATTNDPVLGPKRAFTLFLDGTEWTSLGVTEAQGKLTLEVLVVEHHASQRVGKRGDRAAFEIGGETLTLESGADAPPIATATPYENATQWKRVYPLTPEQAATLARAPLTAARIDVGGQAFVLALRPALAKQFQEDLGVLTQTPPPASSAQR